MYQLLYEHFGSLGQKAQFDGLTPAGEKKYRSITSLQDETGRKMQSIAKNAPGSFIDFSRSNYPIFLGS